MSLTRQGNSFRSLGQQAGHLPVLVEVATARHPPSRCPKLTAGAALRGHPRQAQDDGDAIIMTYSKRIERLHVADYWRLHNAKRHRGAADTAVC